MNTGELGVASWGTEWEKSEGYCKSAEAVNGVTCAHASLQQNVCSIDDTGCFGIGLNT